MSATTAALRDHRVTAWRAAAWQASAVPHAPAPRMAILTTAPGERCLPCRLLQAPDLVARQVALLPFDVADLDEAVDRLFVEQLQHHAAIHAEPGRRVGFGLL